MAEREKGSDQVNPLKNTHDKVIKGVILFDIIVGGLGLILIKPPLPFLTGLVFGTVISVLNFRLLYLTLNKAVQMPPAKAQVYATSRYFIRYIITGIVIYVSIKAQHINVLGTVVGLISLKIAVLATELFNSKQFFINIFKRKEGE